LTRFYIYSIKPCPKGIAMKSSLVRAFTRCALAPAGCLSPPEYSGNGAIHLTVPGGGLALIAGVLSCRVSFRGPGGELLSRSPEPPAISLDISVASGLRAARAFIPALPLLTAVAAAAGYAFRACTALTALSLPEAADIGYCAFAGWVDTPRQGKEPKYGCVHQEIPIDDTP
jgi:hypothetical protein